MLFLNMVCLTVALACPKGHEDGVEHSSPVVEQVTESVVHAGDIQVPSCAALVDVTQGTHEKLTSSTDSVRWW
jgi:urease accessory protein UreF